MSSALRITFLSVLLGTTLLLPVAGTPLGAACTWAVCVTVLARSHRNGLLSLACLYLSLLGLFHLGLVVPTALGVTGATPPDWMRSSHLQTALVLFSVASAAFTLGARLLAPARREDPAFSLGAQPQLFWVGALVAAIGATFLWVGVLQLDLMSSSYGAYWERAMSEDVRFFGFGLMLFPIGLLVAAVGATPGRMFALGGLVLVVLGPLFLRGFRGPIIVHVAALLAIWDRKDARVARRVAVAVVLAVMVLVPAIRVSRDLGPGGPSDLGTIDPVAVLLETGGSLRPVVVTAERIERGAEPLWMGQSYAMAVGRILPNVGAWARPGGHTLSPSAWATMHAEPWIFEHGGGIGFSGVAEPYLNFGTIGVVLFFLLLGLAIQSWDRWLSRDPFRAAIGAATFGFVLWTVRNDSVEVFRAAAFASATVLAAWIACRIRRPRAPAVGAVGFDPAAAHASERSG